MITTESPKHQLSVLMILLIGLLLGCRTTSEIDRERDRFDSEFYWGNKSTLTVSVPAAVLCREANDSTVERELRCLAVGRLFANYIKPGFTSEEMHTALYDPRWLDACRLAQSTASGGWNPLSSVGGRSLFSLALFPDDTGWSPWVVWFSLPNSRHGGRTVEEGRAFLTGTHPDKRLKLAEFAIDHRLSHQVEKAGGIWLLERIANRGVGIMITGN